jgi:hypothetical protein
MTGAVAAGSVPALTIYFQGLCAVVRNHPQLGQANEVVVCMLKGEDALVKPPPLCPHIPVLTFSQKAFDGDKGKPEHFTAIVGDHASEDLDFGSTFSRLPIGYLPLSGLDLRVAAARRSQLSFAPNFSDVIDLEDVGAPNGVDPAALDRHPPSACLVSSRFLLSDGVLSSTVKVGEDPRFQWVLDLEGSEPRSGHTIHFSREVKYELFSASLDPVFWVDLKPFGSNNTATQGLLFKRGSKLAVSSLCGLTQGGVKEERDFLAYYDLAATQPGTRRIPVRLRDANGHLPVAPNGSACPPATSFAPANVWLPTSVWQ